MQILIFTGACSDFVDEMSYRLVLLGINPGFCAALLNYIETKVGEDEEKDKEKKFGRH